MALGPRQAYLLVMPETPSARFPATADRRSEQLKAALIGMLWLGGLVFFASLAFFIHLSRVSPSSPVAAAGQTAQLNNHGSYFYVRFWEWAVFYGGMIGGWALAAFAILLWRGKFGAAEPRGYDWQQNLILILVGALTVYMFWPVRH